MKAHYESSQYIFITQDDGTFYIRLPISFDDRHPDEQKKMYAIRRVIGDIRRYNKQLNVIMLKIKNEQEVLDALLKME